MNNNWKFNPFTGAAIKSITDVSVLNLRKLAKNADSVHTTYSEKINDLNSKYVTLNNVAKAMTAGAFSTPEITIKGVTITAQEVRGEARKLAVELNDLRDFADVFNIITKYAKVAVGAISGTDVVKWVMPAGVPSSPIEKKMYPAVIDLIKQST